MPAFLFSSPRFRAFDANGDSLAGGKLYAFAAGTSTPKTTFQDQAKVASHAHPIVLDSNGEAEIWLDTGTYKIRLDNSADVTQWTVDLVQGILDVSTASLDEWVTFAAASLTFIDTTSFSVGGDQRTTFQLGRRVRTTLTAGTGYHTIIDSQFAASITTVTVVNDSTVLDSGLSAVDAGIISADNPSVDPLSVIQQGLDVISATALPIDKLGSLFDVTGTTTVTSIDAKGIGAITSLQFDGALTLTHHATNLILPGGEDILTRAGDIATFWEYAAGQVRLINYQSATGIPGMEYLTTFTPSGVASVDITSAYITSKHKAFLAILRDITPANDSVDLQVRVSTDGGSTFTTASYDYSALEVSTAGTVTGTGNAAATSMILTNNGFGSTGNERGSGMLWIFDPIAVSRTHIKSELTFDSAGDTVLWAAAAGRHDNAGLVNGIQITFSAGNIESGSIDLYGIRDA